MDGGRLLVFLEADQNWDQLLADLEASGAKCVRVETSDEVIAASKGKDFDAILISKPLQKSHPELQDIDLPLLLADELNDERESELIDPFAQLGDRSVLRTLDRQLEQTEALVAAMEERL
jgi:hypothetical protein